MKWPWALLLLVAGIPAGAQDSFAQKPALVTMTPAPVVTIVQGKSGTVPLTFRIARGYHINSNQPKSDFLIPTKLNIDATTDIVITGVKYPAGQDLSFAFSPDEKLNVYANEFSVEVMVRPLRSVQKGKYAVRGKLKYQACDNAQCYRPAELPVAFDVKIAKAAPPARRNPAQSPHAHR